MEHPTGKKRIETFWQRPSTMTRYPKWLLVGQLRRMLLATSAMVLMVALLCSAFNPLIAVALMGIVVMGVCALWRPGMALLLLFTGAGLPSILIPLPGHTMRLIEPALVLALLVMLLRRAHLQLRLSHLLALLFLTIAAISFLHIPQISTDLNAYAADKRLYELLLIFLAFFCGTALVQYVRNESTMLIAILLCHLPLYLIGLAQALGMPLPSLLEASAAQNPLLSGGRLWGPTSGAATFGLYLVNLLVVALVCWIRGGCRRDRIIGMLMTIATALEIIGSGTRSAAIAALVIVIIALLITRRFKLLAGLVVLIGVMFYLFLNQLIPLFAHDSSSVSNRLFLWQEAITLIITHPWIGIGLQQFPVYYAQLIVSPATLLNQHGISVHNQYLELALESGIFWLVVGVLLMTNIVLVCWKAYRQAAPSQQALLLAAMLAMLATLITSFVDVPLDKAENALFLFLLVGMALGYIDRIHTSRAIRVQAPAWLSSLSLLVKGEDL